MISLPRLTTLFDQNCEIQLPLTDDLLELYGDLCFPAESRPHLIANFVETLDGVIALAEPGHTGGGDISGYNPADQAVMGLLRAAADVVIVGAGQLRRPPGTFWTPENIFPPLESDYRQLRENLAKPVNPLHAIVTATGRLEVSLAVFQRADIPVCIFTTQSGLETLAHQELPRHVQTVVCPSRDGFIPASEILSPLYDQFPTGLFLIEGGPALVNAFLQEHLLDELFLTLAPQVAGRTKTTERPGIVFGHHFAPFDPRWSELRSVKQYEHVLFLRYRFQKP